MPQKDPGSLRRKPTSTSSASCSRRTACPPVPQSCPRISTRSRGSASHPSLNTSSALCASAYLDPPLRPRNVFSFATIGAVFRLLRRTTTEPTGFVESWKKAWIAGAEARWSKRRRRTHSPANRRAPPGTPAIYGPLTTPTGEPTNHIRLAHPLRRSTDSMSRVVRAAEIGAIGLGVLATARWAWRRRQHQAASEP